jgi:hypothetical protein
MVYIHLTASIFDLSRGSSLRTSHGHLLLTFLALSFQFFGACICKPFDHVQEDVLGRAKKAKEQAAREAMEGQGIIPKPTTVETTSVNQGVSQTPSPSTANAVKTDSNPATKGPVLGVSSDD